MGKHLISHAFIAALAQRLVTFLVDIVKRSGRHHASNMLCSCPLMLLMRMMERRQRLGARMLLVMMRDIVTAGPVGKHASGRCWSAGAETCETKPCTASSAMLMVKRWVVPTRPYVWLPAPGHCVLRLLTTREQQPGTRSRHRHRRDRRPSLCMTVTVYIYGDDWCGTPVALRLAIEVSVHINNTDSVPIFIAHHGGRSRAVA